MLKVLYLPLNDATSAQQGTYDGFNQVGVKLEICDFHNVWLRTHSLAAVAQDFLDKVRAFQPNLIHMQLQFTGLVSAATIQEARNLCPNVVITNWSGDIRAAAMNDFVSVANVLDYALISSTGQLDLYRAAGCKNVKYWQIGFDPNINHPTNKTNFQYDISFIANNYGDTFPDGKIRTAVAAALTTEYGSRFGLFGSGYSGNVHPIPPKQMNDVYNNSVCSLSISNFNEVSHYFSDRLLYCAAAGRPTIAWRFPGCESYFVEGSEIFYVKNVSEIITIVKYCKDNPDVAVKIGRNGARKALKEHTFVSRIIELLHITKQIHMV